VRLVLHVWRQAGAGAEGSFVDYPLDNVNPEMSFLEMLDELNERLALEGKDPVAFDHDCREGICGACGMVINGRPHGPRVRTTACQLHMRSYRDGDEIWIEPWRARAFPVIKDLVVDRTALDRIIAAGGFIGAPIGAAQDANAMPVRKEDADLAFDAATCIGCGACVAACPNASAMLFTAAKASHLALLPQGQPERQSRALSMVKQHDDELFGSCTNHGDCEAACPKGISIAFIGMLNADFIRASLTRGRREAQASDTAGG
jgi:succinate dehydrogenase / fumarate reductase iron-sulfur subunit